MTLNQQEIQQLNEFEKFLSWQRIWAYDRYLHMPNKFIFLCTGNQAMKTSSTAHQYVRRILGSHPVPKKNLLYFECSSRNKDNPKPHGIYKKKLNIEGKEYIVDSWEKGTWNIYTKPKDDKCPYCGKDIVIHNRGSRVFRFCSETLPGEKETIDGSDGQSAEVKNTVYPEFKKWLPPFLIKKDITFRSYAMIIKDPWAGQVLVRDEVYEGMDSVVEFVSYSQSVQATAGSQKCSVWEDEEPPKDFHDEQIPRLLVEDGDIVISLTPAYNMCFDTKTEILTDRGWKFYNEIQMSDKLMSYNIPDDIMEWSPILAFNMFNHKGKMTHLKHGHFDFLVTPEHKWVASNARHQENAELIETKDLNSKHILKVMTPNVENTNKTIHKDEFVQLLGWLVSDGTTSCNKLYIYQSETAYPKHCNQIDMILSNYEGQYRRDVNEYTKCNVHGSSWEGYGRLVRWDITGQLKKDLRIYLDGKSVKQDFICSLPEHQLQLLYDAMVDGDGCRCGNGRVTFKQVNNEPLIDAFQLTCTLLGKLTNKSNMKYDYEGKKLQRINVFSDGKRYFPNVHYKSLTVIDEDYDDLVWCPTTINKTVVVRRNGAVSISGNSWTFDSVFEQASIYIRTKAVCDALSTENEPLERIQITDSNFDIGVIQAATDDNPILGQDAIEALFDTIDDPDVLMTRRYGVHKQASGRVFKDFDWRVHVIDGEKYFPTGLYHDWKFVRMIDYHEKNPWACTWVALSPFNEAFVFQEFSPSPEKMVTREISHSLADLSDDFKYSINLIDPLANKIQSNTGTTVMEDINAYFREFKREDNYPGFTGGYWEGWDTKSTRGRDEIRRRLKWSKKCKIPFNNKIEGTQRYAPTLWIFKDCKEMARSLKQWRYVDWSDKASRVNKDANEQTSQKFSHYPMTLEAIFKDKRFKPPMNNYFVAKKPTYFQGRAA